MVQIVSNLFVQNLSTTSQYEPGGYSLQTQTSRNSANMTQRDGIMKFENERIKTLQEERLHIQKKTFTKWMNSFLVKAKMEVEDLFTDLADGVKLLKLLEIISGWGTSRFESTRPVSLQPDSINLSRVSAESSSESEAQSISSVSGVKGSKSKEDRRSGVFRIFGRKGGDKEKEKDKDKRRSSQTPQ
ncbi:non-erythrocytic 1, Spectrin beta chain [Lucilia cuprina]|nr:non-erythrocytic 1, Spectrin beta chain [Lucilia cuprina]